MHFFRSLFGGLMITAVALALPTGNSRRSLSMIEADDVFVRALEHVTFGAQVGEANKAAIEAQVRAHHAALPEGHAQKAAVLAHVHKDYHHTPGEDTSLPQHATFRYHGPGARKQKNQIGGGVHINQARREFFDDDLYARALEHVTFGAQVGEANKAAIEAQVRAHHAALPEGHAQKAAVLAHVHKDYHHTPGEDTSLPQHATFRYHGPGARKQKNQIGGGVHINQARREFFDDDLYARALEHVTFGAQVGEANKAAIEAQVRAHHAALPEGHAQKAAVLAHVHKDYHHTPGEDTSLPQHATFRYHGPGARKQKNQIGGGVHINQARREFFDDDLYARALEHVTFGAQVPEANRATIEAQVRAHHASLPEGHAQKAAVLAHVHKDYHHTPGEDTSLPQHATFRYHGPGARKQKNQIGGGVHINKAT